MSRPSLPSYTSPENSTFHPVFKWAMKEALTAKGLTEIISIRGQYPSPTGPIDFVLLDNSTKKVILPIEIKRTQSDVRGQGRRQARDYWTNLGTNCQTLFYYVTNLELTELFRHDTARPRTSAQRLQLDTSIAGELGTTPEDDFYLGLIRCLQKVLDIVLGHLPHVYFTGLSQFQGHVESAVDDHDRWHKIFIPACFEYIRGAATGVRNLKSLTEGWKTASFYSSTPDRLNQLGRNVDFGLVFCDPAPDSGDPAAFMSAVLVEAYESGKALGKGDDIAELVNEVLKPKGPGIVETDTELAQLLGIAARASLGRDLLPSEEVFDPGSGSGRLLTALPVVAFPFLSPCQVRANEVEPLFAESLSLRLGLTFAQVITPGNAPIVTIAGIESIDPSELEKVRVVVMNPPFLSGIQATNIKGQFANRIKKVSGKTSELNDGQIALEALFLELVWNLVQDGTVIATVFPVQHLHRLSEEVAMLRKFLLQKFVLTYIVFYPSRGVFEGVTKQTILLVGRKGCSNNSVSLVEVQKQVSNVDFAELAINLTAGSAQPTHGVSVTTVSRSTLMNSATEGWKSVLGAGARANIFLQVFMAHYSRFANLPRDNVRRGTVGGQGNTQLTVFNEAMPRYPSVVALIPQNWRRPILNTTENMPRVLTFANAPETTIFPPSEAFDPGTVENNTLRRIVVEYRAKLKPSAGVQVKRTKGSDEIIKNLRANQIDFGAGWVLIQRASRTKGEIGLLEHHGVLLSTNVLMVKLVGLRERMLLTSWLLSIFGQLQLELFSTPQEGMRKLELGGIRKMAYPDFSLISPDVCAKLEENFPIEPAIMFANIVARPSDLLWASIVNPSDPTDCLNRALVLFQDMVDERRGF